MTFRNNAQSAATEEDLANWAAEAMTARCWRHGESASGATAMPDRLPARIEAAPREASARRVPGALDCWWRLGPNIRDQRTARARGVLSVDEHGTYLTVVLASSRVDVWPSDYMLGWDEHRSGTEAAPVFEQVPRYLDLLIDRPPLMPISMEWQQITRRGFREHPGDIMGDWRYDNPWD